MNNSVFDRRLTSAKKIWFGQITRLSAQIKRTKSKQKKQYLRKDIADSAMRYTVLYNAVSDWALGLMQAGQTVPTVSNKVSVDRQVQALKALPDAGWLKDLQLTDSQLANLQDTGADYNRQWLYEHDCRWAVEVLQRVNAAIEKAQAQKKMATAN